MAEETRIQIRRATAAAWAATNPVLANGEFGLDTTAKKVKIGDGATAWNTLEFLNNTVYLEQLAVGGATAGQVPTYNGTAVVWATPSGGGGGTGGPVSGTWSYTNAPYGSFADWEAEVPGFAMPLGALWWVGDTLMCNPPSYAGNWDDSPVVYTSARPPEFAALTGSMSLSQLSTGDATAGQVPTFNGTTVGWASPVDTKGALQVDYYAAGTSGTWSKHPSAKLVRILAVGGGGAGGGGDRRNAGSDLRGGGAGGAGCIVDMYIPADQLGSTEAYSVGSGGVGGTGATAVGSGNDGTAGGNTTFGTSFLVAKGGEQGYSGGGSGNSKLLGCFLLNTLHNTTNGGTGSGGLGNPGGTPSGATAFIPTAGGGGGGMNSASTVIGGGGAGGKPHSNFYAHVIQTDPAAAGGAINGGDGAHGVSQYGIGWGGGGGGCGSVDGTIRGGDGGNGGFPGGGGGGGGGARGVRGGNGGNGGNGMLLIIQT